MKETEPASPNYLRKVKNGWEWQVFHSSAGMAGGTAKTKKQAIIDAKLAVFDLLYGD